MGEVKGYKVFNKDWTCRGFQYTCPGVFEEDVKPMVCDRGFHFCEKLSDCFEYYRFNPENKVAEVIALGEVDSDGKKSCTNKIQIVREITWDEVLRIVNEGKDCTGICNTGNRNTGDWNTGNRNTGNRNTGNRNTGNRNTGDCNTGDWNTGNRNTGDCNTGNRNTGNRNTGDWNTGNRNTGDCNTGNRNTGNRNTGDWNTGNRNTGDCNTGDWNTGDCNTGNRNTGDCNTGDWNKSSFNNGCFMTEEPKISMFNKPSDWSYRDWLNSDARYLLNQIPKNVVEWIYTEDMTDEEKAEHPTHETTGGYLKVLDESECGQLWWGSLTDRQKDIIKALPNFDPEIFEQCTGIRVDE
ncbi:MAG: hypothetical protein NC543_08285 [bacterium]|nr:hypothetical protein [bacterium]MCM1373578.1 hypothetical protein [Muribaculum sp.]